MRVPGCMSLNLFRNELQILFLFRCLASELEFRYPSSSIDLPMLEDEEYSLAETILAYPGQESLPMKVKSSRKRMMCNKKL